MHALAEPRPVRRVPDVLVSFFGESLWCVPSHLQNLPKEMGR